MDVDKIIQIPSFLTESDSDSPGISCVDYEIAPAACVVTSEICPTSLCSTCLSKCQSSCQTTCERSSQACKYSCMEYCEVTCLTGSCQSSCQTSCQDACENSTQGQGPTVYGSLTVTEVTTTTISLKLTEIPGATYYVIFCRLASETTAVEHTTSNLTYTIYSLTPGTEYKINYSGRNEYGMGPTMPSPISVTTLSDSHEFNVEPWSWTSSNGSASAAQTNNAYRILRGEIPAENFSHFVWNDLVDKIVETQAASGVGWLSGLTAAQCKVSAGSTLSASVYNAVRNNVNLLTSTGISGVSSGDELKGSYITGLTDALNSYISSKTT